MSLVLTTISLYILRALKSIEIFIPTYRSLEVRTTKGSGLVVKLNDTSSAKANW